MTEKQAMRAQLNLLLSCVAILCIFGLVFVYSSSSVYALERYCSASYFAVRHLYGLMLGFCALMLIQCIPTHTIKTLAPLSFFVALGTTALTLVPTLSHKIHGSQRWLALGSFSFQPSELLKITLILYLACILTNSKPYHRSTSISYTALIGILGITSALLLKQPDFGLAVTLVVTSCMMLFISRLHSKPLFLTVAALIPVVGFLVLLKPYRLQRILTFLNPWDDPQGAGFQIIQSLIAIGSGGFWGVGISHSKQKFFYLPMQHTDFIFSIIAEETGFIGSLCISTVYLVFLYAGLRLASRLHDPFCSYTILGFIILLSLQAIINLCVTTGLAPTKGIGLPFISYGNTALVCSLSMIGIIINFTRNALTRRSQ